MGATEGTTKSAKRATTKPVKVLTTETLTLTKMQYRKLARLFGETNRDLSDRARGLFDYRTYTVDQIVVAMYAAADAANEDLYLRPSQRSTMARSLAVAKAWKNALADTLIDTDDEDHVLQLLSQIANYTPGEMVKYANKRATGEAQTYGTVTVKPRPTAAEQFEPYPVEITWGSGEKVMTAIVEDYMDHRVETTPELALEWLTLYRNGVRYASNEYRAKGRAHNKRAADARKGDGDGTTKKSKGAKNAGGTGGKGAKKAEAEKAAKAKAAKKAAAKPRTPAQRPLGDATVHDLLTALALRVADGDAPITQAEYLQKDSLDEMWEKRLLSIPVGMTKADVKGKGKKARVKKPVTFEAMAAPSKITPLYAVTPEGARQNKVNRTAPVDSMQCGRVLLVEQRAGRITAKKRKAIMAQVMAGDVSQAKWQGIMAKITAKADMAAAG